MDAWLTEARDALARASGTSADELELSDTARDALGFLANTPRPTAGMVRAYLRVPPRTWPELGRRKSQKLPDSG